MMLPEVTYSGIVHRNSSGSVTLSEQELVFRPDCNGDGHDGGSITNRDAVDAAVTLPWYQVVKHQVSPVSHPKSLLKVTTTAAGSTKSSYTFAFPDRDALENARREISSTSNNNNNNITTPRPQHLHNEQRQSTPPSSHYIDLDPIAAISTRSSLLASDPALRAQHRLLVLDGGTLSEEDFWSTHTRLVANEYAKISGRANRGMSSDIKSSLDLGISSTFRKGGGGGGGGGGSSKSKESGGGGGGSSSSSGGGGSSSTGIVHLGVEEMRQIFLMYPAVHRAYEEKVPLELSEEQFWRKYLESEYFHRDRGRMGTHINKMNERERRDQEKERSRILGKRRRGGGEEGDAGEDGKSKVDSDGTKKQKEDSTSTGAAMGEDEAMNRLAAAGTDDIFSRYDAKGLSHHHQSHHRHHPQHNRHRKMGISTQLAVGKFDLTSTTEVERGDRFLGKDLHPLPEKDSAGSRIIDKYNRHWAIVLHPMESKAGVDLAMVAAQSVKEGATAAATATSSSRSGRDDEDAKVNGGCDNEMRRLVGFANADYNHADFARGMGDDDEDMLELNLHNVGAYTGNYASASTDPSPTNGKESDTSLHLRYAKILASSMRTNTEPILREEVSSKAKGFGNAPTLTKPFPDPKIGRGLLEALTKKMAADSQTEEDVQQLVDALPEEFTTKLASFFRRSTELLRHFFSLRSFFNENSNGNASASESQKNRLTNIVKGMEKVHKEMYELTRNLPLMESKMFKPIMEQLDWAFKLYREDSSKNTRGGFVTVANRGFVPVAN
ncbi:hypothetical protein ACHAXH_009107 [Discostella pseudostelligera]